MSLTVTYVGRKGTKPRSMNVEMDEQTARQFCKSYARTVHRVVLSELDDDGVPQVLARWEKGVTKRNTANGNVPSAQVVEGEVVGEIRNEPIPDETEDADSAEDHDDESHHFEGRCMKCRTNWEFVGRVVELANGSKAARGTCPVCGTGITRMVARTTPLDPDWEDDEPAESDPASAEDEAESQDEDSDDEPDEDVSAVIAEAEQAIANAAPEDATVADLAQEAAQIAVEFSDAAAEVEAAGVQKPKRAPRKTAKAKMSDAEKTVQELGVTTCPHCQQERIPVKSVAGIKVIMLHPWPERKMDRCPGSNTPLQGEIGN